MDRGWGNTARWWCLLSEGGRWERGPVLQVFAPVVVTRVVETRDGHHQASAETEVGAGEFTGTVRPEAPWSEFYTEWELLLLRSPFSESDSKAHMATMRTR